MTERVHLQEGVERMGSQTWNETMANAAYVQGLILVAVLQKVGPVVLGEGWFERAKRAVALTDPVDGRQFGDGAKVYAVPRDESGMGPWEPKVTR